MKKALISILLAFTLILSGCSVYAEDTAGAQTALNASDYFSDRDLSGAWDESKAQQIVLNGESVTITEAGVYVLSGTISNGSVTVNAGSEDKVQLVLNNVSITSAQSAAIYVENADKTFITLAAGSQNTLTSLAFDESSDIDAVIFSRDDLVLNGSGSLTITSAGHGIVGKDDLKITGGAYVITAEGRGIDANDSIRIYDGDITVTAGKDAIRAKHDDADKGYIVILGGTFHLTAGGGAKNGAAHTDNMMGFGRGGWNYSAVSTADTASTKGVKASGDLLIAGGSFTVDAADDAFHTDSDLTVYDGVIYAATGDDGMHANSALTVYGGQITIAQSYEGIEAQRITIAGGNVSVKSSDDGLNAAGGNDSSGFGWYDMFSSDGVSSIVISGGTLYVNAEGDGIDSNGDLAVSDGVIVVSGPTNSGNGALDYNGTATITGGTVIAAGAAGMAENFGASSTQASVLVSLSGGAGTITVKDSQGNVILSGTVEKNYSTVVISSPDLTVGQTYTVSGSSGSAQMTVTSATGGSGYGQGGGWMNNNGGFPGGGWNGNPGGGRRR